MVVLSELAGEVEAVGLHFFCGDAEEGGHFAGVGGEDQGAVGSVEFGGAVCGRR